ncbi:MAG: pyrroline-5-carboxylate reductase [Rickettsiella sp.]|nr:pyrroline-5-carboxylate reductase [Rickettsiella sp.]
MKNSKISFIGTGKMANSLILGLLNANYNPSNIWATNTSLEKINNLKKLKINVSIDNRSAVNNASVVILAVKPKDLEKIVIEIADLISDKRPLVISIAAAITLETLQNYLNDNSIPIIRCMPNTPASLNCGASGLLANPNCSPKQKDMAESIFRSVGIVIWVNSDIEMDSVAALSGSGPAYFFLLIEALQNAGTELGLSKETSAVLSLQTALGAARMAIENADKVSVEQLRKNVTSPGGTTQAALEVLQQGHFSELIESAMAAAKQRAETLANQSEKKRNNNDLPKTSLGPK